MNKYDAASASTKIYEELKKINKELKPLNIMVLGKTGSGKSTLINSMFMQDLADTGIGKPVTDKIRRYEKKDVPLVLYDSPGFELAGENSSEQLYKQVCSLIKKGLNPKNAKNAIHCIWYVVGVPTNRFENSEEAFLKKLLAFVKDYEIPVILVLSQAYSKSRSLELKKVIEKENLDIKAVLPVLAKDYQIDEGMEPVKAYGLDALGNMTFLLLPQNIQETFVSVCKDPQMKHKKANDVVMKTALTAAATGAIPTPGADAAALIPQQIYMLAKITSIYGFPVEKSTMMTLLSCILGTSSATLLGKTISSSLLKLIPGVGSLVGGAVNAATAGTLTTALGKSYIALLDMIVKGELKETDLKTEKGKNAMKRVFKKEIASSKKELKEAEKTKKVDKK